MLIKIKLFCFKHVDKKKRWGFLNYLVLVMKISADRDKRIFIVELFVNKQLLQRLLLKIIKAEKII